MLLFLMLAVAVLTITMLGVARNYRRSIIRDREVEMMHRGDQYARAVQRFYRKNKRYPISIEQLENFNKVRYLRKRYKDPMSPDGAWKLVHATDVKLKPGGGLATGTPTTGLENTNTAGLGTSTGLGSSSGSAFGSSQSTDSSTNSASTSDTGSTTASGSDTNSTTNAGTTTSSTGTNNAGSGNAASGQVLGGGDVWGVVSKLKTEGIHSFGDKTKYNEWFFIYVPDQDKNQLLVGPYNPNMIMGGAGAGLGNSNKTSSGTGVGTSSTTTPTSGTTDAPASTSTPSTNP
jgi:hypothetical protein